MINLTHNGYPHILQHRLRVDCGGIKSAIFTLAPWAASGTQECVLGTNETPVSVNPFTGDKTIHANDLFTGAGVDGCTMPACKMENTDGTALSTALSSKIAIDANGEVTLTHSGYPHTAEHKLRADCGGIKSAIITVAP